MIDLHTHTIMSDGELLPSELVRRAKVKGYTAIGISDHVDSTNMEGVIAAMRKLAEKASAYEGITVIAGVELTHVPPVLIGELIAAARKLGALYVVVHGETIVEPVQRGTNRAAIEGGADILAHPGLITEEEVRLAKEKGVFLEITTRRGHSLTTAHVARLAETPPPPLSLNTQTHDPGDPAAREEAKRIVLGAGLTALAFDGMRENSRKLVKRIMKGNR